jgi:glycosyltransferase involved in cell wall biosynthesis
MIKVMHIITALGPGGAETMLCGIASGMDGTKFHNEVVSLTGILDLADRIQGLGVRVRTLHMNAAMPNPLLVVRLAQWMRKSKPDVIQTWMYHANLTGALAARLAGGLPVVWGIHHSTLVPRVDKRRTILINRACALLSRKLPARIVCCSEASLRIHKELAYAAEKLEVIPNGIDLQKLKPDPAARLSVREELGLSADTPLIGMAARFHPQKDHQNFARAASLLHRQIPGVHFLLCGLDVNRQNSKLTAWIEEAGIRDSCHLLGVRQDMARLFAAMDIATTASLCGEAFPIVIGEAMACEIPCVVTDVGDSALIVGNTGKVVAPGDATGLAQTWRELLEGGPEVRRGLGTAARRRVEQNFALPAIVNRYQALYERVVSQSLRRRPNPEVSQCPE